MNTQSRNEKKITADRLKCQTETAFELCTASCARYVSIQQNGRVFIQQLALPQRRQTTARVASVITYGSGTVTTPPLVVDDK